MACKPEKRRKKAAPIPTEGVHAELLDDSLLGNRPNPMPVRNGLSVSYCMAKRSIHYMVDL